MFGLSRKREEGRPFPTRVTQEGDAVRVFAGDRHVGSFRRPDVESVRAWKQDCLGFDRVWLGFDPHDSDEPVCVHKETDGFMELVTGMRDRCRGYSRDWYVEAAFPAFANSHTWVWRREGR